MDPYPNQDLHQKRIEALTSLLQHVVDHQQRDRVQIVNHLTTQIEESVMPKHAKQEEISIINKILLNKNIIERSYRCTIL